MRSKGQISINFSNEVNFKDFLFQTVCVCGVHRMGHWGAGVKHFSVGVCHCVPSTACSCVVLQLTR